MKRLLYLILTLLFTIALTATNAFTVIADEGEGEHTLEVEVNGIHVTLASQNDWKKGENTIVITLMDSMGMPVTDANVEILIGPKPDEHAAHGNTEIEPVHGADQGHSSMPGMDMSGHSAEAAEMPAHDEESSSILLHESENGTYVAETHLEASGAHEVNVMFHVNGEMLQADFAVEIVGGMSKTIVLWSFVAINIVLIASAGVMKKQSIPVKGR